MRRLGWASAMVGCWQPGRRDRRLRHDEDTPIRVIESIVDRLSKSGSGDDREYAAFLEDRAEQARWVAERFDADADEIEARDAAGAEVIRRNARAIRAMARRAEELAARAEDAADRAQAP